MEMLYSLEIRSSALRLFKKLPNDVQAKILAEAQILKTNPMAGPTLKGKYKHIRSLKFNYKGSAYRVAYQVLAQTSTILIRLAGTRENFYKYLERVV